MQTPSCWDSTDYQNHYSAPKNDFGTGECRFDVTPLTGDRLHDCQLNQWPRNATPSFLKMLFEWQFRSAITPHGGIVL
jgi:hypothetical protein